LKDLIESLDSTGKIERQILDLAHRHLNRTRASPNKSVPVACNPMGAERRRDGTKNHNSFSGATDLDAPNPKTWKHRVCAGARGIFHPRRKVMASWEREIAAARGGLSLVSSIPSTRALRIGVRREVPARFVCRSRAEIPNVVGR
jgi:hypothetical protein